MRLQDYCVDVCTGTHEAPWCGRLTAGSAMRWTKVLVVGLLLAVASTASMAFEEQKMNQGGSASSASSAPAAGSSNAAGGLGIAIPELQAPKDTGTKIRVPGLGVIGEIPKMDFGLELLYGASQNKQLEGDRTEANGVMLRSKIPLGSSR